MQHGDAVGHRHRLGLVVGHVERRRAQRPLDACHLGSHPDPELRVEIGQRLVHQERPWLPHDRAAHRDPLPLAARQRLGAPVQQLCQAQDLGRLGDPSGAFGAAHPREPESERHVVAHRHVRVQGVALEDHRKVAVGRRYVGDFDAVDQDVARGGRPEPGDYAQRRRLTAAGWADQYQELAVVDGQIDGVEHGTRGVVGDGDSG